MLLRAIIVDDEKNGINTLRLLIGKFLPEVKVVAESHSAIEAIDMIENYLPEIVFLDINMPVLNGFELLERLKWRNFNLVFVTAHDQYGLRAIKNNAVDYILKPIDYHDLQRAVSKIKERIAHSSTMSFAGSYATLLSEIKSHNNGHKLLVNLRSGVESVDPASIIFLESKSHFTHLYLDDSRVISTSKELKEFEIRLCTRRSNFLRVHKSFIINLSKVVRYHKLPESIILSGTHKVPLAKTRKNAFLEWLGVM